jgi:DNA modification methylase
MVGVMEIKDILKAIASLGLPEDRVYARGDVVLLNADCKDVVPLLPPGSFDAVVIDPPYGIGADKAIINRANKRHGKALAASKDYGDSDWDNEPASATQIFDCRRVSRHAIIFGGNYFELPPARCWLVWDKLNGENDYADCELAWTNLDKPVRRLAFRWHGMLRDEECERVHPTQKPVGVMRWVLSHLPKGSRSIVDPFAGSSSTLVACIHSGFACLGIEREPKYFAASIERLDAEFDRTALLERVPARVSQADLFSMAT